MNKDQRISYFYKKVALGEFPDKELEARKKFGDKMVDAVLCRVKFLSITDNGRSYCFYEEAILLPGWAYKKGELEKLSLYELAHEVGHIIPPWIIDINCWLLHKGWYSKNLVYSRLNVITEVLATLMGY